MKKMLATILSLFLLFSAAAPVWAAEETLSEDIVILYTNDIHSYIDGSLSYDVVAAVKQELKKQYKYVFLADAGDHIQGTAYGSADKGETIIKMMNAAEYDIATLGNHEFDYKMDGCLNVIALAEFPYVSANFYHEENGVRGENVLDSFAMFDCGEEKLAFVGITTPETFLKSTPAYFQDANGNFIYGISGGENGAELQQDVQKAIDEAKNAGATQIVALGHLGIDPSSQPWTSTATIAGICGLDAFIDGHSHSTVEGETVKDKDGHDVLLTQTGSYFDRIGIMVIDAETDAITTDFIEYEEIVAEDGETVVGGKLTAELYGGTEVISDSAVKAAKDAWISEVEESLGETIGSVTVTLDNYDAEGNRLVRTTETNSGDFAADALYYLFDSLDMDVDVAILNGGGIRNSAIQGDITYKICKDMHPFGNVACLQTVTGQQLLDALEWGTRYAGVSESGAFPQVSGITFQVDTAVPNTIEQNERETWVKGPENYRVRNVEIYNKETDAYEPLELDASYNLAGYNYTLRDLGDGYAMFEGAVNVLDYVMEDYMVLANYIQGFENSMVGATNSPLAAKYPGLLLNYGMVYGSGRIEITEGVQDAAFEDEVWVGGIKVTAENRNDVLGDGGSVKYDPATDTLTLTDASVINEGGHGIYANGITLTVNGIDTDAEGSNTISGKCTVESGVDEEGEEYTLTNPGCGIYVEGDGYGETGGIIINGIVGNITAEEGCGISAYEDVIISGTVGDVYADGISSGIESVFGSVIVEKSGVLGNITAGYNGIAAGGNGIIAGKAGNIVGSGYAGIHCTGGDVIISGSVESITGEISGIEAYKNTDWDEAGNEVYTGGSVTVSGTVGKISGGSFGIYTELDLNVSGSAEVSATDIDTDDIRAVSAGRNIISVPEDYRVDEVLAELYEEDSIKVEVWHKTVFDTNENPARTVRFIGWDNPFADVHAADWYYSDVRYAAENGLFNGTTDTTFSPDGNLTRAMLVTVLYRAEGEPAANRSIPFADVDMSGYYANAVSWAKQTGIVNGVTETEFAPNSNITREQIAAIMHRYAQYKGYDVSAGENTNVVSYDDFDSISGYAIGAVQYAVGSGLMNGKTESTLNPQDFATRAETAAILHRFMESNQ